MMKMNKYGWMRTGNVVLNGDVPSPVVADAVTGAGSITVNGSLVCDSCTIEGDLTVIGDLHAFGVVTVTGSLRAARWIRGSAR